MADWVSHAKQDSPTWDSRQSALIKPIITADSMAHWGLWRREGHLKKWRKWSVIRRQGHIETHMTPKDTSSSRQKLAAGGIREGKDRVVVDSWLPAEKPNPREAIEAMSSQHATKRPHKTSPAAAGEKMTQHLKQRRQPKDELRKKEEIRVVGCCYCIWHLWLIMILPQDVSHPGSSSSRWGMMLLGWP